LGLVLIKLLIKMLVTMLASLIIAYKKWILCDLPKF
jgi:hypothetical protein